MSYFYFIWKSHRSFLLFSMIIISLLQFLILKLVTTIDYSSIIMSLTMVLSSFEKEGNKVGIRVAGIALVFYLLHYLSSLWNAIQFTKPFNIFTYYQPEDLMTGQRSFLLHFMVLSSLILLCLLVSIYQFNRRDIPG